MAVAVVVGLVLATGILAALVAGSVALFRLARAVERLGGTAEAAEGVADGGTAGEPGRVDSRSASVPFPATAAIPDVVPAAGDVTGVAWIPPAPVAALGSLGYGLRYAIAARRGRISAADPVPVEVRAQVAAKRAADRAATKAARREVRRAGLAASGGM